MNNYQLKGIVTNFKIFTFQSGKSKIQFQFNYQHGKQTTFLYCFSWDASLSWIKNGDFLELTNYRPVNETYLNKNGIQTLSTKLEVYDLRRANPINESPNNVMITQQEMKAWEQEYQEVQKEHQAQHIPPLEKDPKPLDVKAMCEQFNKANSTKDIIDTSVEHECSTTFKLKEALDGK